MHKKTFSIFEISVIIIAAAVLLAAFLAINNMLANVEKKALIMQIKQYNFAAELFTAKYHALPGDVRQTKIFKLSEESTDGDGDNLITDSGKKVERSDGEIVKFWFHLTNSGLIAEKFNGKSGQNSKIGATFPASKLGQNVGIVAFGADGKNYFQIGFALATDDKIFMKDSSLTAEEAENLDRKIDDGNPSRGFVFAAGGTMPNNTENPKCKTKNSYNLSVFEPVCQLRIELMNSF